MELINFEENSISSQLTVLEHKIRELESDGNTIDTTLLNSYFELISKKNLIFHRRLMLEIYQNEQDLERKCYLLQSELHSPTTDSQKEEILLKEFLRLVDLRDKLLIEKFEEENILCQEELIGKQVHQQNFQAKSNKCKIQ